MVLYAPLLSSELLKYVVPTPAETSTTTPVRWQLSKMPGAPVKVLRRAPKWSGLALNGLQCIETSLYLGLDLIIQVWALISPKLMLQLSFTFLTPVYFFNSDKSLGNLLVPMWQYPLHNEIILKKKTKGIKPITFLKKT